MSILRLTLKKKWFDLIASGEKKEEYRDIKTYWFNRLTNYKVDEVDYFAVWDIIIDPSSYKNFTHVEFKNGYSANAPTILVEFKGIVYAPPSNPLWVDSNQEKYYFVIKLGKIVEKKNIQANESKL